MIGHIVPNLSLYMNFSKAKERCLTSYQFLSLPAKVFGGRYILIFGIRLQYKYVYGNVCYILNSVYQP